MKWLFVIDLVEIMTQKHLRREEIQRKNKSGLLAELRVSTRKGATMVEYALLAGAISLSSIAIASATGIEVGRVFSGVSDAFSGVGLASGGPTGSPAPETGPAHGYDTDDTDDWLHGTPDADTLTMTATHLGVIGYESADTITGVAAGQVYLSGPGNDSVTGTGLGDVFVYMSGDGNDVFNSYRNTTSGVTSVLKFPDLNPGDLTFRYSGNHPHDLFIDAPGSQQITVDRQWYNNGKISGVNSMTFAGGVSFDEEGIRSKMIQDSQPTGTVNTTALGDVVDHNSAEDGNYTVNAPRGYVRAELFLSDADAEDFTIFNSASNTGTITVNGDVITVLKQFSRYDDGGFQKIILQDGTDFTYEVDGDVLTERYAIAGKMLDDSKATGTVYGSDYFDQKNVHKLGVDGSYTVFDRRNPGKNTLRLPGVTRSTFSVRNDSNQKDGFFDLPSGEVIRVDKQFYFIGGYGYDTIILDDETLDTSDLAQVIADGARAGGTVYGTREDKVYTHYAADPQVTIIESRYNGAIGGTLYFPDLGPDDVIFNNTISTTNTNIFLKTDGAHGTLEVYLPDQTRTNYGVDKVRFSDDSVIDWDGIRQRVSDDMYPPTAG